MKIIYILIIIFAVLISLALAVNYQTLPELYRVDRVLSLNQTGENFTVGTVFADRLIGNNGTINITNTNLTENNYKIIQNSTHIIIGSFEKTIIITANISKYYP